MTTKTDQHTPYLIHCTGCGGTTSKAYARAHGGQCKSCSSGPAEAEHRTARIIDHGYQAYATEEGHYDDPRD